MNNRKLTADWLFDGYALQKDKILILDEDGAVLDVSTQVATDNDVERYKGILVPGFINCHCHLELSHLKNSIAPKKGLVDFLLSVIRLRKDKDNAQTKADAIAAAEKEMYENGIVAVADIVNTADTTAAKKSSAIQWHTLVEVINLWDNNLEQAFPKFQDVQQLFEQECLQAVITPHAPYSVSAATMRAINEATTGQVISVHNQETAPENELFEKGTGRFLEFYELLTGSTQSPLAASGKSSMQTWLSYFTNGQTIMLVHNTYTQEEDIIWAKEHAAAHGLKLVYCLCPNANQYIEDRLPPVDLLIKHNCHVVLGTDSYSSNWQLSIVKELATLQEHYPHVPLITLLQWATYNGAQAVGWGHLGSFEKGKTPGVVLLQSDFSVQRLA
jgi:aminodeoxyfutalosine deaminase